MKTKNADFPRRNQFYFCEDTIRKLFLGTQSELEPLALTKRDIKPNITLYEYSISVVFAPFFDIFPHPIDV